MKDVIITHVENANSQGVTLCFNKPCKLNNGGIMKTLKRFVSWDSIGKKLVVDYTDKVEVSDLNKLRGES